MSFHISRLFIYPIKSCAGIEVSSVVLGDRGPECDRKWMLVDAATGLFLSQRKFSRMALIHTKIENNPDNSPSVFAQYSGCEDFKLPVSGSESDVQVWDDQVVGHDCGDEAAAWFSAILETDCRLIYQGEQPREADTKYAPERTSVSFADGFPMLVINESSVGYLNERCESEVAAERFRANLVISGADAFDEKNWTEVNTDNVEMAVVKPCQRCVIPSINPQTGEKNKAVMKVLVDECRQDGKVYFGQNLTFSVKKDPVLTIGDSIELK